MQLKKTYFILPNLFTLGNIFCGFFALTRCAAGTGIDELYEAALAICLGFLFDLLDGRVARLTKTQSELGLQLDSLADVVTFGAAPALLVYKWGLSRFGMGGIFVAFFFAGAAALRLARFNVLAHRDHSSSDMQPGRYFLGLPTPAATAVIVALVVVHYRVGGEYVKGQAAIATLVLVLAYLMTSRVRFRSFKDLRLTKYTIAALVLITLVCTIIVAKLRASFVFIFLISCYLGLGLTEEIYRFAASRRRSAQGNASPPTEPGPSAIEEQAGDDDIVLRELGGSEP